MNPASKIRHWRMQNQQLCRCKMIIKCPVTDSPHQPHAAKNNAQRIRNPKKVTTSRFFCKDRFSHSQKAEEIRKKFPNKMPK